MANAQNPASATPAPTEGNDPKNPKAVKPAATTGPRLNFANGYLNTPEFGKSDPRRLSNLQDAAENNQLQVYLPSDDKIKESLRERLGDKYSEGLAQNTLNDIKREYERYENKRFNSLATSYTGALDTTYNKLKGRTTVRTTLDERPTDPMAVALKLRARKVAQEFGQSPEQMVQENAGRSKDEEDQNAQYGVFERTEAEQQLAKDFAKQAGFVNIGKLNPKTGQYEIDRDADGFAKKDRGPVNPLEYGYTMATDDEGKPTLVRVEKLDVPTFRGELLNVNDLIPDKENDIIARAVFSRGTGAFSGALGSANESLMRGNSRYELDSGTGFKRSANNYLGYIGSSMGGIQARANGLAGNKDREAELILRGGANQGAMNPDMQGDAFGSLPSFFNATAQLSAQLTVQTALGAVSGGTLGLAATGLDAAQSGYYEGRKNGLSDTEANVFGALMGGLAFGIGKAVGGQASSKLNGLIFKGAQKEISAIIRAETSGLAQLVAKQATAKGMSLSTQEIGAIVNEAKPWLVKRIGGRISALYDTFGQKTAGAVVLGGAEEAVDEFIDTGMEDGTRALVRAYMTGSPEGRPEWVKKSLEDGSNAFAYKSVGDIMNGAMEAGALGAIGGVMVGGPYAGLRAQESRKAQAEQERWTSMGQTEAFAKYMVENDFSTAAVEKLKDNLTQWRHKGMLGRKLRPDGTVTENEKETENEVMYRTLTNKVQALSDVAKQADLLKVAAGGGKSQLAMELSNALGKEHDYERTQQGLVQLLDLTEKKQVVTARAEEARIAIQQAKNPSSGESAGQAGDDASGRVAAAGTDPDQDGITAPGMDAEAGPMGMGIAELQEQQEERAAAAKDREMRQNGEVPAEAAEAGEGKKGEKKGKKDEASTEPAKPNLGTTTPALEEGQTQLDALGKLLGDSAAPVLKWNENMTQQLALQEELLNTEGEQVEKRAELRQQVGKLQKQQETLEEEMTRLSGQSPAVGSLRAVAEAQHAVERASIAQRQLFDGTLLSYQVQEGIMELQAKEYERRGKEDPASLSGITRMLSAITLAGTNPETQRFDAAWMRQQLIENEEYVARRRFAPLATEEMKQIEQASLGQQGVAGLITALDGQDADGIEQAIANLEQLGKGQKSIPILDAAQQAEAQALLGRSGRIDQRENNPEPATSTIGQAGPLQTEAPANQNRRTALPGPKVDPATATADTNTDTTTAPAPAAAPAPTVESVVAEQKPELDELSGELEAQLPEVQATIAALPAEQMGAAMPGLIQRGINWMLRTEKMLRKHSLPEVETLLALATDRLKDLEQDYDQLTAGVDTVTRRSQEGNLGQKLVMNDLLKSQQAEQQQAGQALGEQTQETAALAKNKATLDLIGERGRKNALALFDALHKISVAVKARSAELTQILDAGKAIVDQRMRVGVRSLLDQLRLLQFQQLLQKLQPVGQTGRAALTALRNQIYTIGSRLAARKAQAAADAPVVEGELAPGIGGIESAVGQDTQDQILQAVSKLTTWGAGQLTRLKMQQSSTIGSLEVGLNLADEPAIHKALAYFNRDNINATGEELRAMGYEVLQQYEEEQIEAANIGAHKRRVAGLIARLQAPLDLADVRGSDPDSEAEIQYLTGQLGVPGLLRANIEAKLALSDGNEIDPVTGKMVPGKDPEFLKSNFAAMPRAELLALDEAARRNLGLALYRLHIVPLLSAKGMLPNKVKGMGLKALDGPTAGRAVRIAQGMIAATNELIQRYDQLGSNRYRDDDAEHQAILADRHSKITALLESPAFAADTEELRNVRVEARKALDLLATANQANTATFAHLDAAEAPLRAWLRAQPGRGTDVLESLLQKDDDRPMADQLKELYEARDGDEAPIATVLTELAGRSRSELIQARLRQLTEQRGDGETAGQPKNTDDYQLSLEQEHVLQTLLNFASTEDSPLAGFIARRPDAGVTITPTGIPVGAVGSIISVTGKPGSGKTFLTGEMLGSMAHLLGFTQANKMSVLLSAPHESQRNTLEKEAKKSSARITTSTVTPEDLIKQLQSGTGITAKVIVMDEATALSIDQAGDLTVAVEAYNAKKPVGSRVRLIMMSDPLQLPGTNSAKKRSNASHPFISQNLNYLRTRPLKQIYRSGYAVLHTGLDAMSKRILSGIDRMSAQANDVSPVADVRYAQPGDLTTLQGWTYLGEAEQRTQIVGLIKDLARTGNPENATVRVLVAPGQEQQEIEALQAAGLTFDEARGIVMKADDPRLQLVLNYDQAQGGTFNYTFVATDGESQAANQLRATYVGVSRATQYASVRLLPGQQAPATTKEPRALSKYEPMEGAKVKARNVSVNAQLVEAAGATKAAPVDSEQSNASDVGQDAATEEELKPEQTEAEEKIEEEVQELNALTSPVGTTKDADNQPENETEPATSDEAMAVRSEGQKLLDHAKELLATAVAVTDLEEDELTDQRVTLVDSLSNPLTPEYTVHMDTLTNAADQLQVFAASPLLASTLGPEGVVLQQQAVAVAQELTVERVGLAQRRKDAITDAGTLSEGMAVGESEIADIMNENGFDGKLIGIDIQTTTLPNGQTIPVNVIATHPKFDNETGAVTGYDIKPLGVKALMDKDPVAAWRMVAEFAQTQEQIAADAAYALKSMVATNAARRGRVVVNAYALPVDPEQDGPTPTQQSAKAGFFRRLFDVLTVGPRNKPNTQSLTADMLSGVMSEQGGTLSNNGNFRIRYAAQYSHNYLGYAGESPTLAEEASSNRFVVEYVDGANTLTLGTIRYDKGREKGRIRPTDTTAGDTALDSLLQNLADGAFGSTVVSIGKSVKMEGWRNGRMYSPKRFSLPYSKRYSGTELRQRLAAEGKSASSLWTVTTPENRRIMLSSQYALHEGGLSSVKRNGLSGRQVVFVSHGTRSASEIDAMVERAMREIPLKLGVPEGTNLAELNDKQLSQVLQRMLEEYDLQLQPLGNADLTLADYGTALRSSATTGVTLPRPSALAGLRRLLSTQSGPSGEVEGLSDRTALDALLPFDAGRNAMLGSLFTSKQGRATDRPGKGGSKDPNTSDDVRPGLINALKAAMLDSGIIELQADTNDQAYFTVSDKAKAALDNDPVAIKHLLQLARKHMGFWPDAEKSRISSRPLQDLMLYLDYLDGKGLKATEAMQQWQDKNDSQVQFNGYVPKAAREKGKAPLFARTMTPPGLDADALVSSTYNGMAEPSFQLDLNEVAAKLSGALAQPAIAQVPIPSRPEVDPAPAAEPETEPAPREVGEDGQPIKTATEVLSVVNIDEFGGNAGYPSDSALGVDADALAQQQAATDAAKTDTTILSTEELDAMGVDLGAMLEAGFVSNPEPALPDSVWADVNWVLGEDHPRDERDTIIGKDGLPADYTRILGKYFRGIVELNRMPDGMLSRVAGRHEPLHAIMDMLSPDLRQRVLSSALEQMRRDGIPGANKLTTGDIQVEEWLADQFVQQWPVWRKAGEEYRNHPVVQRLSKTEAGRTLLKFWSGIRSVYQRYIKRQDAIARVFEAAHRGEYIRSRQQIAARSAQQTPARYASVQGSQRKAAYEALSRGMGIETLQRIQRILGGQLYGGFLYKYRLDQNGNPLPPMTAVQAVANLRAHAGTIATSRYLKSKGLTALTDAENTALEEARALIGTPGFMGVDEATRDLATVQYLLQEFDAVLAPNKTGLEVLLGHRYSFMDFDDNDAYAEEDEGKEVVQQREGHLVDKDKESLEGQRLLRQLETVPRLTYEDGQWRTSTASDVIPALQTVRNVLFRAYAIAKADESSPYILPGHRDIARALHKMVNPQTEFGIAAASVLARFYDSEGDSPSGGRWLPLVNAAGQPSNTPSFRELSRSDVPGYAQLMGPAMSEMHSFFQSVEPRQTEDVQFDALAQGVATAASDPLTRSSDQRKNIVKSRLFLHLFTQKGNNYQANPAVIERLAAAGFKIRAGNIGGKVEVTTADGRVLLEIRTGRPAGTNRAIEHLGGFPVLSDAQEADFWNGNSDKLVQLVNILGLGATIDSKVLKNVLTQYNTGDGRDYNDPSNLRSYVGVLLAKTLGMSLASVIDTAGDPGAAAIKKLGDPALIKATMYEPVKKLKESVNQFLLKKNQVGKEVLLLTPTIYWQAISDVQQQLENLTPEREQRFVWNEKGEKKSTNRNTTALYPRLRGLKLLAKHLYTTLPPALAHLGHLVNPAGGYISALASGSLKLAKVREMNVLESKRNNKRKALVKASAQELNEYNFWGGFLGKIVSSGGAEVGIFNTPRSDKPSQDVFIFQTGDGQNQLGIERPIAWVDMGTTGQLAMNSDAQKLVQQMQQSTRSLMTKDSFEGYSKALKTLLRRPLAPGRNQRLKVEVTPEQKAELARLQAALIAAHEAATARQVDEDEDPAADMLFGREQTDAEQVANLAALGQVYTDIASYLLAQDPTGYWLTSMKLSSNVDFKLTKGKPDATGQATYSAAQYSPAVLSEATMPRQEFIRVELESLLGEADSFISQGVAFVPTDLALKAYMALNEGDENDARKALAPFATAGRSMTLRKAGTEAKGDVPATADRYNPLLLSYLLTHRVLTSEIEQVINGHRLYFKGHGDLVKRGIARKTPIEIQDAQASTGMRNELGVVVFEDLPLNSLHNPENMATRYQMQAKDGSMQPIPVADQAARQQTPVLLGLLTMEDELGAVADDALLADIVKAGNAQLANTDSHDGISFMNPLQYRLEAHGYGDKDLAQQTMQKNVGTGQERGASTLIKTASMIFFNDLLKLGNEHLYGKFIASMGGMTSLPMRAWMQARITLQKQSAAMEFKPKEGEEAFDEATIASKRGKWLADQLHNNKDWELAEQLLQATTDKSWRRSLSLAAVNSAAKSGANGQAAPLDHDSYQQRVALQLTESGRILSLFADPKDSTIARITQEEHIPALLGNNFKTTKEVYTFLEDLATQGLIRLDRLLDEAGVQAKALGMTEKEGSRQYLYKALEGLMQTLDQRGTTLSAVQQNLDPNITLLQQQLQTAIAGAINSAVSKLRFKGVRASVASLSGLVNMYEVTTPKGNYRMTRAELLAHRVDGKPIVRTTPTGELRQGDGLSEGVSFAVDELRFLHVKDAAGNPISQEQTIDIFRTIRKAEKGDAAAIARVTGWGMTGANPEFVIEPAEVLAPRSILAAFFSPSQLQRLKVSDIPGFTPQWFADREAKHLLGGKVSRDDAKVLEQLKAQANGDEKVYTDLVTQLSAARGTEIHANLQAALRPKGTRIPVTNLNSMQLYRIAGFFDSHNNTVIVPSEVLTISGADNDGDQITFEFFETEKRGLTDMHGVATPSTEGGNIAPADPDAAAIPNTETATEFAKEADADPESAADADALSTEQKDAQPENANPLGRSSMAGIRRKLFAAKRSVLTNAANLLDLFAPIDIGIFAKFRDESQRQQEMFAAQLRGNRADRIATGNTKGAYEVVSNILLHLANQAGKTGVGPFVKARELVDAYALLRDANGQPLPFAQAYHFLGREVTSIGTHWREISRQLERLANAALDNAKEGYLGYLNVNENTWGMWTAGSFGGMSFDDMNSTINHIFMRRLTAQVVNQNHIGNSRTTTVLKRLSNELRFTGIQPTDGKDKKKKRKPGYKPAVRGWYASDATITTDKDLFLAVNQRALEQVRLIETLQQNGTMSADQAWLSVYGFTRADLREGRKTVVGETETTREPLDLASGQENTTEEKVRRYIVEQNFMLAHRAQEMRNQISLLAVLGGVNTNDYDAYAQGQKTARILGLDGEDANLAEKIMEIGYGGTDKLSPSASDTMIPTADIVKGHNYLRAALVGLGRDMQLRRDLLLRRMPQLQKFLEMSAKSAQGYLGKEADRYNWSRSQMERLADLTFVKENPLEVSTQLDYKYPALRDEFKIINKSQKLGQHTPAGQEMLRRAIARILLKLQENPTDKGFLAGAGQAAIIQQLQFSAQGRRLEPEVRNGAELTPEQKGYFESVAAALPLITAGDAAAGELVQKLLLYNQLVGGGLRVGRGQLTEMMPASIMKPLSDHRTSLFTNWEQALEQASKLDNDRQKEHEAALRKAAKEKGPRQPLPEVAEARRAKANYDHLAASSDPQVQALASLFKPYEMGLNRPEWLPQMVIKKELQDGNPEEREMVTDNDVFFAKNAALLPQTRTSTQMREDLGSKWTSRKDAADNKSLPWYTQLRTSGTAGHHVYGMITDREGKRLPLYARHYRTAADDSVSWAGGEAPYSVFPIFDDTEYADGRLNLPQKSEGWDAYQERLLAVATKLAEDMKPYYEAKKQTPETAEDLIKRIPQYAYGHRKLKSEKKVVCKLKNT